MKGLGRPEARKGSLDETHVRMHKFSSVELTGEEVDTSAGVRCWEGEVEVEDRWGIGSPTTRPDNYSPYDGFEVLEKSKSRQRASRRLHRAGRRVFSCFRHSTINLTVPDLEPSTPPKSGPLIAPRKSASSGNGHNTYMNEAIDHHHHSDPDEDLEIEEPTSPVVNCMGQVKKTPKHSKKIETPRGRNDSEKFRRTKSQAPTSPPKVAKSKSCKWKQLLRSPSSSTVSPSNHPLCEGEIDLGRFSSASGASEPFVHHWAGASHGDKRPDKTGLLMRRNSCRTIPADSDETDNTLKLLQEQLDERGSGNVEGEHTEAVVSSEPVFRKLPSLKTMRIESPKWFADETLFSRRQGVLKPSRLDLQSSSKSSALV